MSSQKGLVQRIERKHSVIHPHARIHFMDRQFGIAKDAIAGEPHIGIHHLPAFRSERLFRKHFSPRVGGRRRSVCVVDVRVATGYDPGMAGGLTKHVGR